MDPQTAHMSFHLFVLCKRLERVRTKTSLCCRGASQPSSALGPLTMCRDARLRAEAPIEFTRRGPVRPGIVVIGRIPNVTTPLIEIRTFQTPSDFCSRDTSRDAFGEKVSVLVLGVCVALRAQIKVRVSLPTKGLSRTGQGPENPQTKCKGAKSRPAGCIYMWGGGAGRGSEAEMSAPRATL